MSMRNRKKDNTGKNKRKKSTLSRGRPAYSMTVPVERRLLNRMGSRGACQACVVPAKDATLYIEALGRFARLCRTRHLSPRTCESCRMLQATLLCASLALVFAQGPTTTPVPILKQINRQNDDGSYSYGYEAADGSFKIETKYPNGDVAGKYGYVDENGKLRETSYGASSKRGFEPQGADIMVPPPTLHDPSNALTDGQEDDGQYREDPKIYEDPKYNGRSQKNRPSPLQQAVRQYHRPVQPEPEYQQQQYQPQQYRSQQYQPQQYQPQQYQPQQYQPQQYRQQQYQEPQHQQQYQPQSQTFHSSPLYTQQTSLSNQFPSQVSQNLRPQSQIYHSQPQFSYQAYTPQPYQQYQNQNYNPFVGHPAQNFDPNTGSYTINFSGK